MTNTLPSAIILLVPNGQAPIAQLDRAFDYESKGHRFESCWVHHEPLTSFALLAVVFFSAFQAEFFFLLFGFFIISYNQIPQKLLMF